MFDPFQCPQGVNPLYFSQMCVRPQVLGMDTQVMRMSPARVPANFSKCFAKQDGFWDHVLVGDKKQLICIPRSPTTTVLGNIGKMLIQTTYLVEQADHHSLLMRIEVNQCLAKTKATVVPVTLVNTNNYNIWLRQPLPAAKLYNIEYHPWEYKAIMNQDWSDIKIRFQVIPSAKICVAVTQVKAESDDSDKIKTVGRTLANIWIQD